MGAASSFSAWRTRCKPLTLIMSNRKLTRRNKPFRAGSKRSSAQPLKRVEVALDGIEVKLALILGDGDVKLGLRRAVVLAVMRHF
jgi:hypothetical protein